MQRNTLETVMGAIVLAAAAGFVTLAYEAADIQGNGGYEIIAEFGSTGGLSVGDDVRISGIKIGKVTDTNLNAQTFGATVTLSIDPSISLPADSAARIAASSLLGGNHVEILPGFEEDMIPSGGMIYDTRDPVNLTDLLGKAVFSGGSGS